MKFFDFLFEESLCSLVYMREIVDENKNEKSINTSLDDNDLDQINIVKEIVADKFMVQEKTIFNLHSYIENSLMSNEELQSTLKTIKYAQHLAFVSYRDLNDLKEIENNQLTTAQSTFNLKQLALDLVETNRVQSDLNDLSINVEILDDTPQLIRSEETRIIQIL